MHRTSLKPWVAGVTAVAALGAGCITVRPVMVDRKTALENDILGGFERLNRELPLLESPDPAEGLDPDRRRVLQALLDQQLEASEVAQLKAQGTVGEDCEGLLSLRSQPADPAPNEVVKRENGRRMTIYRGLIAMTPELGDKDLAAVRRFFRQRYVSECQPGDVNQDDGGAWRACPNQRD